MNIFCIGRNYVEHINELGNEIPEDPVIFIKPESSIYNFKTPFIIPAFTQELHYELELVLKVSKKISQQKNIQFNHCCNEITVGIDFTARDIQNKLKTKGLPWEKAKAFDNATVLGKFISLQTLSLENPIEFSLIKNEVVVQHSSTAYMLHNFNQIIEHISMYFTLHEGDLIFTGTPAGVGITKNNDRFIGRLHNHILLELSVY